MSSWQWRITRTLVKQESQCSRDSGSQMSSWNMSNVLSDTWGDWFGLAFCIVLQNHNVLHIYVQLKSVSLEFKKRRKHLSQQSELPPWQRARSFESPSSPAPVPVSDNLFQGWRFRVLHSSRGSHCGGMEGNLLPVPCMSLTSALQSLVSDMAPVKECCEPTGPIRRWRWRWWCGRWKSHQ